MMLIQGMGAEGPAAPLSWWHRDHVVELDRHIRSERFGVLLGTKSLLAKPSEINIHTVSLSEGVEVVNALRGKGTPKKNV